MSQKETISIDGLTKDEWFDLMTMAHEQDITLNQLINNILTVEIERLKGQANADQNA